MADGAEDDPQPQIRVVGILTFGERRTGLEVELDPIRRLGVPRQQGSDELAAWL